jgi:hypothetical protein
MDLRLNLDDTNFEQLLEKGRSMIPGLAPDWTDHNIHDPGIMLLELLAHEAEAQIYALSALRRDERVAYARLLGIEPRQPNPAVGLIWPSQPPQPLPKGGLLLEPGTRIVPDHPGAPGFVCDLGGGPAGSAWRQILTDAELVKLETQFADGRTADQTRVNGKNGATFLPFGPEPAAGDSLVLSFEGKLDMPEAETVLVLGAETPTPTLVAVSHDLPSPLAVALRDDNGEQALEIVGDTTAGLLQSGIMILARPSRRQSGRGFQLVLRNGGLLRSPRLRRIAPNVVPVIQRRRYIEEPVTGNDMPDQMHLLEHKSWIANPVFSVVERRPGVADQQWTSVDDFRKSDPDDRHFTFDPVEGELQFGNGINGRVLPRNATISIEYFVSSGLLGNLGSGNTWTLAGLTGTYGQNSEACSGGRDADTLEELQIRAIEHLSRREPLVTRDDLADAARALPQLGVARAIELRPSESEPRGTRTLLVVAERGREDVTDTPEGMPWLKAVRRSLAARIPLGQRLRVIAPKYVDIRISAKLTLARTADAAAVARDAETRLIEAFALTNQSEPTKAWGFGRDVTATAIKGWLRGIAGVAKVVDVKLHEPNGKGVAALRLEATALPRLILEAGDIVLERPGEAQR